MTKTDIPDTMSAWLLTGHGGPEVLKWATDVPVPTPADDEVLIEVGASSVNNTDINTRIGWYSKAVTGATSDAGDPELEDASWSGAPLGLPRIQGADCCGRIVAVGAAVDAGRIGERVLVRALQQRPDAAIWTFGSECDGGFAEYAVARSSDALAVSSDLTDATLAALPCAFGTALGMLERAGVGANDRVLVTGASGGVGAAAVQLCAARGAEVVGQTSDAKAKAVRDLGAAATLGRDESASPESFDVVIDLVAGPGWPSLITALRRRGRYVASGAIAGPMVSLDVRDLYLKDLTLLGSTEQGPELLAQLITMVESGDLVPHVSAIYPLADLPAAQEAFQTKTHVGKIAIQVASASPHEKA